MKTTTNVKPSVINKKIVIPQHRRDKDGSSKKMGMKAEQQFWYLCQKNKFTWTNASKYDNCNKHIDCYITLGNGQTISVDVKAAKKIARRDLKQQDKLTWIEWIARDGRKGWARSEVQFIAFQQLNNKFLMVDRQELETFITPLIEQNKHIVRVNSQRQALNGILWKRYGNKDAMTLIDTEQLALLKNSFFID